MSVGASETFANALKAFRRGVHQFPFEWKGIVVCNTILQVNYAMREAEHILGAGSLRFEVNRAGCQIKTEKGGDLRFVNTDNHFCDRIRGCGFPHVIILGALSDQMTECLRSRQRSEYVDAKYFRWDHAYA